MKKFSFKKLLLSSLIALQLTNSCNLTNVYAKEESKDLILFDDDGKILHLVGLKAGDYETITFGYVYRVNHEIYFKDAIKNKIYNVSNLDNNYVNINLVYADAIDIFSEEEENSLGITRDKAIEVANKFSFGVDTVTLYTSQDEPYPYYFDTFEAPGFDNSVLHISNSGLFDRNHADDVFYDFSVTDDYDEALEDVSTLNNYKLGITTDIGEYEYYSNIYQNEFIGKSSDLGIITCYYVLDDNGERVATLRTQKEIDAFLEANIGLIDRYTWKVSFYTGSNIKPILNSIDANRPVSPNNTTYFIDYNANPVKELKYH